MLIFCVCKILLQFIGSFPPSFVFLQLYIRKEDPCADPTPHNLFGRVC